MLTLHGKVLNVFQSPTGTSKDGTSYGGGFKVQFLGENVLKNGEKRNELLTLATDKPQSFQSLVGGEAYVEVGVFVSEKRDLVYFLAPGAEPVGI